MENLITRYRNVSILVAVLFAQIFGLAVQVRRSSENESSRLIRIWAIGAVTPVEKAIVWCQHSAGNLWHEYFYLRGVRQENRDLKQRIERLQIEQVRLNEDAEQAHRLQALLSFKEQFISRTVAAQVIGSSGSEQSRSITIDKGARQGIRQDMAVITPDGVVGKVLKVYGSRALEPSVSQVLLIDDQTSGVGAILEKSRLQGVLRGTPAGGIVLEKVMSDETVQAGERVLTSGGDRIFPKGLPVGIVTQVSPGPELFLNIRVKPSTNLGRLEEVLVITQEQEREPAPADGTKVRAADILAERLPSVPETKPLDNPFAPPPPTSGLAIAPAKPSSTATPAKKDAAANGSGPSQGAVVSSAASSGAGSRASPGTVKGSAGAPTVKPTSSPKALSPRPSTAAEGADTAPKQAKPASDQPAPQNAPENLPEPQDQPQ